MGRSSIIYLSSVTIVSALLYYAAAQDNSGFKEKMTRFIEKTTGNVISDERKTGSETFLPGEDSGSTFFKKGEWSEYTSEYQKNEYIARLKEGNIYYDDSFNINLTGAIKVNLSYGKSHFASSKYKQYDEDRAKSRIITSGFFPEQSTRLHVEGGVGNRVKTYIDHDSSRKENQYMMNYTAASKDEVVREINAGEIDIKFNHSKYAVYDNTDAKGLGVDFTVAKGDFTVKAFGSITRGETAVEYFRGSSSPGGISVSDFQYVRKTYYQLEPFLRYDSVSAIPSGSSVYSLIAVTSNLTSLSDPTAYTPSAVNISPTGFELYIDDQNQYNNNNAIVLSMDGGYYTKMVNGADYSINYSTGVITLLKDIPESSRIFAVYNRTGGTLDPCALSPGDSGHPGGSFSGKIFVFIKYGYSINEDLDSDFVLDSGEDKNGDGKLNIDVYEIRSTYYLGAKQILASDFSLKFYQENELMSDTERAKLGKYKLDLTNGTIAFYTREPYRPLLALVSSDRPAKVYSEQKKSDAYIYSKYRMLSEYYSEARNFKLKHGNIIEKSVRVKINEKVIPASLYSVNYDAGMLYFANTNNPVISSDSRIEVKYEYLPFGKTSESFVGGVRADYDVNNSLRFGGSFVISKDGTSRIVPDIGKESSQTLLAEGDATLKLSSKRLADLYNTISGGDRKTVPAEFTAYAEYAKSFKDVNTFGKAMIDNMESSDETVSVSLSEKDWILSSMPSSYTQADRGLLNYYFYRDPDSPGDLKGEGYSATAVSYPVKPGPFNIAMGHVVNSITKQKNQKSLVFDYNFSTGGVVSAVTRRLSTSAIDLSGVQYVEVWVKYSGTSTDSVNLYLDIGTINEDSDDDGVLDTEDANSNGYIDSEPSSGYSEDRGYTFNPSGGTSTVVGGGPKLSGSTKGDGVLTSEDLNGNGELDTAEKFYTVSLGSITPGTGGWQKIRVYIDQSTLTAAQVLALQETRSIRFYLTQGSGVTGRVAIDTLKIVNPKWRNPELDGTAVNSTDRIKLTMVNSINDAEYRSNSFLYQQSGVYESLYGDNSTDEIEKQSETALQIEYSIPSGYQGLSIKRKFTKEFDIRFYKTMNLWINARSISTSNTFGFVIGSSDNDYIEYRYAPDYTQTWREIKLKLSDSSTGDIAKYSVTGNPDLKRIKYIKMVIYGANTTGKIWLNEIYVSEPEKLSGTAKWYEFKLRILEALFRTSSGTPVFSDININYIYRGHSSQFSAVNKTIADIKENTQEVFVSTNILPSWYADMRYINEKSSTDDLNEEVVDTKRGDTVRDYFIFNSFLKAAGNIPSIVVAYSIDRNNNRRTEESDNFEYFRSTDSIIHSPVITYRQDLAEFLFGKLSVDMVLDLDFSRNSISRNSITGDNSILSGTVALAESTKKQESDAKIKLNYENPVFYLRPFCNVTSREIVQLNGGDRYDETGVSDSVNGGFHIPFARNENQKYMERYNGGGAAIGIKFFDYLAPEYTINADYKENGFKDIDDGAENFFRKKNSLTNLMSGFKIPVLTSKTELLKNVRHLQFDYKRSLYFTETDVPYEGEQTGFFDEQYGISSILSGLSPQAYNLFSFYPGFFFLGRSNAGKGRDLIYKKMNSYDGRDQISNTIEYNNTLKLTDKFTADMSIDLKQFRISISGGLGQVCERSNIYGIPNQVVSGDIGIRFEFDLMKMLSFGFFRPNSSGMSYHSSQMELGLNYTDNMLITYNIDEKKITPSVGLIFKWDRSSLSFKYAIDFRIKKKEEFISPGLQEGDADYIYLENMEGNNDFSERDYGHKFASLYETDIRWLYDFFSDFYKLTGMPIFSIEYKMEFNRYDYTDTVSPEPYDLYMLTSKLTLDLHKNVQGGFAGILALENFRNRENNGISREIISYQLTASVTLVF